MKVSELKDFQYDRLNDILDTEYANRIIALAIHLDLTVKECVLDIKKATYGEYYYEYGNQEYLVLTDDEANKLEEENVRSVIEDCYLWEYQQEEKKTGRSNPLLQYLDIDKWVEDWCGYKGHNLASYDGIEYEIKLQWSKEWWYIYRTN